MQEPETTVAEVETPVGNQWAVVCTGFVDKKYNVTQIKDSGDKPCPVIVRMCKDQAEARKFLKRLQARHGKVEDFLDTDWEVTTPIYGVAETSSPAPKKRAPNPNAFGRGTAASNGEASEGKSKRKR